MIFYSFLSLFLSRKKKAMKREIRSFRTKESKKKDRGRSVRHAFIGTNDACANISTKTLIHIRIFGMFFRFSLKFMLFNCGSILGRHRVPKIRSCFLSEFYAYRTGLPRFFFLLCESVAFRGALFLLSFSKEGRKMRKNILNTLRKISFFLKH